MINNGILYHFHLTTQLKYTMLTPTPNPNPNFTFDQKWNTVQGVILSCNRDVYVLNISPTFLFSPEAES